MDSKEKAVTNSRKRKSSGDSKIQESPSRRTQSLEADLAKKDNSDIICSEEVRDQRRSENGDESLCQPKQPTKQHSFETNVLDHCETPRAAYEHLGSFLTVMGKLLNIQPATDLRIWDPFYCDGAMKAIFQTMGYNNIIHNSVDFYQLIRDKKVPTHDILVTNPPYSEDHIHRLLDFVVNQAVPNQRPSCLLLPNWVSRQPDYGKRFTDILEKQGHELFYLSPVEAYTYTFPSWVKQEDRPDHVGNSGKTTPYLSSWYLVVPKDVKQQQSILDSMDALAKQQRPPIWVVAKTVKGLKWKIKKVHQRKQGKKQKGKKR